MLKCAFFFPQSTLYAYFPFFKKKLFYFISFFVIDQTMQLHCHKSEYMCWTESVYIYPY